MTDPTIWPKLKSGVRRRSLGVGVGCDVPGQGCDAAITKRSTVERLRGSVFRLVIEAEHLTQITITKLECVTRRDFKIRKFSFT